MIFLLLLLLGNPLEATEQEKVVLTMKEEYVDYFVACCVEYKIPVLYAYKLIVWESRWDAACVNKNLNGSKDYGLMKHNSKYIKEFAWRYNKGVMYDPLYWKDNLRIGLKHLSVLYKNVGNWYGAIAAYNMGLAGYKERLKSGKKLPEATLKELAFVFQ